MEEIRQLKSQSRQLIYKVTLLSDQLTNFIDSNAAEATSAYANLTQVYGDFLLCNERYKEVI